MSDDSKKPSTNGVILIPLIVLGQGPCRACAQESGGGRGHSRVANDAYQSGWETLFGKKTTVGVS